MNIEAEIWYLVTLFAAFELSVNLKVIAKIANAQFQTRIYITMYKFHIGDHPTAVICLPIAAESFR